MAGGGRCEGKLAPVIPPFPESQAEVFRPCAVGHLADFRSDNMPMLC